LRRVSDLRRKSETPPEANEAPDPAAQGEPAPHPAASLHVFPRDPFKEMAALRIPKRPRGMSLGPAGQDPFRRRPDAFKTGSTRKDPFAPLAAQPAAAVPVEPPSPVAPPPPTETSLTMESHAPELDASEPAVAAAPEPEPEPEIATEAAPSAAPDFAPEPPAVLIPPGGVFLDADVAAATTASPAGAAASPPTLSASTAAAPSAAATAGGAATGGEGRRDYYGRRIGGGDGSGGGEPPKPKRFDQDDLAAAVMAILLLLLLGWAGMGLLRSGDGPADDRRVAPQAVVSEPAPAPAPDPFAGAPVDLTPRSPAPALPSGDPEPVPEAASPQTALAAAPQPDTAAAPGVAPTCDPTRILRAYFCTAKADLTAQSRAALEGELQEMGSCTDGREWVVRGFTDTRGAETFNTELASRRAATIAGLLREKGLTVSEVVGVGKLTDIEQGQNCANQRRVDVSLKTSIPPTNRACAPLPEEEDLICP